MTDTTSDPTTRNSRWVSRRRFLGASALSTAGLLAGCSGGGDGGDGGGDGSDGSDGGDGSGGGGDGGSTGDGGSMQTELSFISGPPESLAFGMGNAMSSIVRDNSELTLNVKSGTSGNAVSLVGRGQEDLGWGTTLIGTQAMNASGPFEGVEFSQNILQLPSYYYVGVSAFVPTSSDFMHFADLEGESLAPGPSGASYWGVWELALDKVMNTDNLEVNNSGVGQLSDILSSGRSTAVGGPTYVNTLTPGFMQQVFSQNDVRMLDWSDEATAAIQEDPLTPGRQVSNDNFPDVAEFTADGETFIVTANYVMWTSDAVGEETIYTLLKTNYENRQALGEAHAAFKLWSDASWYPSLMTTEVPVHPGAVKFLKEIDAWNTDFTEGSI